MKLAKIVLLAVMAASILGCVSSPDARKKSADPQAAFDQHIKLAMQYIGSKSRDLARVHLQKAERFESSANKSQLHNGYALLYQMEQEIELAEQHYRKAISSNKKDSMVRYNFAAFLYNQGRFQPALEQMQLVTEDLGYERRTQAFYILGLAQRKTGQGAEALKSFARASQLTPGFAPPYLEAAEIYFEQQKLPIAKRALDQYAYLAPPSAKSLWLAVRLEHSFGNRDGASRQGLKLKNLFPYSSENLEYQKWLKQ
jgi:type IV pilus assembly protein PilF